MIADGGHDGHDACLKVHGQQEVGIENINFDVVPVYDCDFRLTYDCNARPEIVFLMGVDI